MLSFKRNENQTMQEFMIRSNSILKDIRQKLGRTDWDEQLHKIYFKFAGHIARMGRYAADRATYRVFRHYDWREICRIAALNKGDQTHGRIFRPWRWERSLYCYFNKVPGRWESAAEDLESWNRLLDKMSIWRTHHR